MQRQKIMSSFLFREEYIGGFIERVMEEYLCIVSLKLESDICGSRSIQTGVVVVSVLVVVILVVPPHPSSNIDLVFILFI